jgi:acyl-CoA synthetase (AMP-forming)/AMP-acid ligase II
MDRIKDMLNVGGFKIFSCEVEDKLYEHPAIELCAIIGVPNPHRPGTEMVKLFAQLTEAYASLPQDEVKAELSAFARESFAPYKVPQIIEVVDNLPLTPVGKVDKKVLRRSGWSTGREKLP